MSKKIVILEKKGGDFTAFKYLFWCDVPATRQKFYANASAGSVFVDATTAEIAIIKAGSVVEIVDVITVPPSSTVASVQSSLVIKFNQTQTEVTAANPWNRYGSFYDGTSWTLGGVS